MFKVGIPSRMSLIVMLTDGRVHYVALTVHIFSHNDLKVKDLWKYICC